MQLDIYLYSLNKKSLSHSLRYLIVQHLFCLLTITMKPTHTSKSAFTQADHSFANRCRRRVF